jgi:hypothetical protein
MRRLTPGCKECYSKNTSIDYSSDFNIFLYFIHNKYLDHDQKSFHPLKYPDGTNGIFTTPILWFFPL